jgi:hypothetical protein
MGADKATGQPAERTAKKGCVAVTNVSGGALGCPHTRRLNHPDHVNTY